MTQKVVCKIIHITSWILGCGYRLMKGKVQVNKLFNTIKKKTSHKTRDIFIGVCLAKDCKEFGESLRQNWFTNWNKILSEMFDLKHTHSWAFILNSDLVEAQKSWLFLVILPHTNKLIHLILSSITSVCYLKIHAKQESQICWIQIIAITFRLSNPLA